MGLNNIKVHYRLRFTLLLYLDQKKKIGIRFSLNLTVQQHGCTPYKAEHLYSVLKGVTKVGHLFFWSFAIIVIVITRLSEQTFCNEDFYKEKATYKRQAK